MFEVAILGVTLNNDLTCRLVKWDKVSPEVISDLVLPSPPNAKKTNHIFNTSREYRRKKT